MSRFDKSDAVFGRTIANEDRWYVSIALAMRPAGPATTIPAKARLRLSDDLEVVTKDACTVTDIEVALVPVWVIRHSLVLQWEVGKAYPYQATSEPRIIVRLL